jgi:hypothetical protein
LQFTVRFIEPVSLKATIQPFDLAYERAVLDLRATESCSSATPDCS